MDSVVQAVNAERVASDGGTIWIAPGWEQALARAGVRQATDLFKLSGDDLGKATLPSWRQRLRVELIDKDGKTRIAYLKHFRRPPLGVQLRRWLIHREVATHAAAEKRWIDAIAAAGVGVPRVLAVAERRIGWWEVESALLLDSVSGESLERWVIDHPGRASCAIIETLADVIRRFHDAGFTHRDLYASHVFIDDSSSHGVSFALIDLQRVLQRPLRRTRWITRDLAQLHYSVPSSVAGPRERLRWLRRYLGGAGITSPFGRRMIRLIERKAQAIRRRDQRRRDRLEVGEGARR